MCITHYSQRNTTYYSLLLMERRCLFPITPNRDTHCLLLITTMRDTLLITHYCSQIDTACFLLLLTERHTVHYSLLLTERPNGYYSLLLRDRHCLLLITPKNDIPTGHHLVLIRDTGRHMYPFILLLKVMHIAYY